MSKTFRKHERLCHKKVINSLFDRGNVSNKMLVVFPFRLIFQEAEPSELTHPRVLFSVSKRNFKRAADRNLLKRRIREAYRQHKEILDQRGINMVFIFVAKELLAFAEIERAMISLLKKLRKG